MENYIKNEQLEEVLLSYIDKDEEGNRDVFYKKAQVKVVTYTKKTILEENEIDDDVYTESEIEGIMKVYYKNGDMHEENVTMYYSANGDESHYYHDSFAENEKALCRSWLESNSKIDANNEVVCNLEKIEIYWTKLKTEICTCNCEYCGKPIILRSADNDKYCHNCGCNFCDDCLTKADEEGYPYLCPDCIDL